MIPLASCRACGGTPLTDALRVRGGAVGLRFRRCGRCGAFLQDPFLTPEQEAAFYDRYPGLGYDAAPWELAFLEERLRRLERWTARGRLLDVGCGRGYFVRAACGRGWDAFGVELSQQAKSTVLPEVAARIRVGDVGRRAGPDAIFDVATLYHVIEHLREPRAALGQVARLLRPGGLLVVATPNAGSLVARLLGERWAAFRMPDHCVLYSPGALVRLLEASGFDVVHAGSAGQPAAVAPSAGGLAAPVLALRRRAFELLGMWGGLRRAARRAVIGLGLGDAMEVVCRRGAR